MDVTQLTMNHYSQYVESNGRYVAIVVLNTFEGVMNSVVLPGIIQE